LSALFVWPSLTRKGAGTFLSDRLLRLGLPFVLAMIFLMPIAMYPTYLVSAVNPSLEGYWRAWMALPFWPSGPQWFLWQLLVLNVAAAALYRFAPGSGRQLIRLSSLLGANPKRYFLALAGASALAYVPLALAFSPWEWAQLGPLGVQLCRPLHYAVY